MNKTLIHPELHTVPLGAYSPGLLVEHNGLRTLFLTGQLAVDHEGTVVAPDDAGAQTEYVFELIGSILRVAGMEFSDIVKAQTFLTNIHDFEKFSAVRNRYFADSRPVSTLLEVKGLAHEGCCVEIEVIAMK
ncbi:MAG TPA: RidA family protein [Opitutaceae bacterium]|nr:RidA family protein [Opitutaceae bacterium]